MILNLTKQSVARGNKCVCSHDQAPNRAEEKAAEVADVVSTLYLAAEISRNMSQLKDLNEKHGEI